MYADLTVEENLRVSQGWRLPEGVSAQERQRVSGGSQLPSLARWRSALTGCLSVCRGVQIFDHTLSLLGVKNILQGKCRTRGKDRISGGQLKRVSVAMDLVAAPRILFLGTHAHTIHPQTC
jgi:ABC-type glutathione transport system ATPase component